MKKVKFLIQYKHKGVDYDIDDVLSFDDNTADALFNAGVVSINGESKPLSTTPVKITPENSSSNNVLS